MNTAKLSPAQSAALAYVRKMGTVRIDNGLNVPGAFRAVSRSTIARLIKLGLVRRDTAGTTGNISNFLTAL